MATRLTLEIAVDSHERAVAAEQAGADRIELCADLGQGGLTPSIDLVQKVRASLKIPVHTMVRPRAGDFVYTENEFRRMEQDIAAVIDLGIDGLVLGILLPDHSIDVVRTQKLVHSAGTTPVTFHRAFDSCRDKLQSLEDVISTGAARLLTSGGAPTAQEGLGTIEALVKNAGDQIAIITGAGIDSQNIAEVVRTSGASEVHTGLSKVLPYDSNNTALFEAEIRSCARALRQLEKESRG